MTPPQMSPEEQLRSRALDAIRSQALEAILEADEPLRTVDVAREVSERLGLDLNEEEMGGLASLARMVLDSDPLFSQANRQWDLALRMGRAEGDRRKPVERAMVDFIDLLGHPSSAHPVAVLTASVYGRQPDYYERMVERLVPGRKDFFRVGRDRIGISRWLLEIASDDPEDVEYDNFVENGALEALGQAVRGVDGGDPLAYARSVLDRVGAPVDNRALQFLVWCRFPETDPADLFTRLYADADLFLERGPTWVTAEGHREVLETIRSLIRSPEAAADLVAATVPAEEEEIGILAPTTVRVSDEDLDQVYDYMRREERTHRIPELCQQVLEAFPGSRTYTGIHDSLLNRMREDDRFQWVGFERFRVAGTLPPEVEVLPEGLAFDDREYLGEEGAEVDKLVDPREWKFKLDEQIEHYLVQDVGDDATLPAHAPPARLVSSPPLHHYVAGTRYLRNSDRGFFPTTPDLVQVTLVPPDEERFDVWVNNRLGLILGLKEWYDSHLPWVGGQFVLEPGEQPDECRLLYSGEVEPLMNIPLERLQQLLALRAEAESEALPWTEIVQRLLQAHPQGIHFVMLFAELNVVRRTRRALLASILSAQRFFTQNPQQPGIWSFDEKRAAKTRGKKKGGPRRPMREMDEDEDEEFEYE
jgi:hypothetical protein